MTLKIYSQVPLTGIKVRHADLKKLRPAEVEYTGM